MTLFTLYSIKDRLNGFIPPIPFETQEQADRWFKEQEMTATKILCTPDDFELWKIGEYDYMKGIVTSDLQFIRKAVNYANNT